MPSLFIPGRSSLPPQFQGPVAINRDTWQALKLAFWQTGMTPVNRANLQVGSSVNVTLGADELGATGSYPADGTLRYISYADHNDYDFNSPFTIAAWTWTGGIPYLGVSGSTNWYGEIAKKNGNYIFRRSEDAGETNAGSTAPRWSAVFFDGTNVRQLTSSVVPVAKTLSHVVMVVAGLDITGVFVDGVKTTGARTWFASGQTLTNVLEIGGSSTNLNETFGGLLWDVRIYSYALSDAQVWSLLDPRTRWDLYAVPQRSRLFFDIGAIARRFLLVR